MPKDDRIRLPFRWVAGLLSWAAACLVRARQRRTLGELDDAMLKDIGLTRAEVEHECAKPFWRR